MLCIMFHKNFIFSTILEVRAQPYIQMAPDSEYAVENEDKPLPEFHGEPVPDDDDEIIVEGVAKKRSVLAKKGLLMQEEEPAPGDEHVEIDFCKIFF